LPARLLFLPRAPVRSYSSALLDPTGFSPRPSKAFFPLIRENEISRRAPLLSARVSPTFSPYFRQCFFMSYSFFSSVASWCSPFFEELASTVRFFSFFSPQPLISYVCGAFTLTICFSPSRRNAGFFVLRTLALTISAVFLNILLSPLSFLWLLFRRFRRKDHGSDSLFLLLRCGVFPFFSPVGLSAFSAAARKPILPCVCSPTLVSLLNRS